MPLQATSGAASYDAFGGGVPVAVNYIEDVFSTWLYTGTGSAQTITNNIDLSTKGGLVWLKNRTDANDHGLFDTVRGAGYRLISNTTDAQNYSLNYVSSFNATGFSLGAPSASTNASGKNYVSWTFREQPKFFDVVTFTGTQNSSGTGQIVNHNLGSTPGCIIVKPITDTSGTGYSIADWIVYHRALSSPTTQYLKLNSTAAIDGNSAKIKAVSDTTFTAGWEIGYTGIEYVAYVFAHDAGGFGLTGTDNVISCGTYTTDGSGVATVSLGYEPQWVLTKATSGTYGTTNWVIADNMRGMPAPPTTDKVGGLFPNTSGAEDDNYNRSVHPTSTGFVANQYNSTPYIYIAIRRGPMKTPTVGTSVYQANAYTGNATANTTVAGNFGFPVDLMLLSSRSANATGWADYGQVFLDRLRGSNVSLGTGAAGGEDGGWSTYNAFDVKNSIGWGLYGANSGDSYFNNSGGTWVARGFGRAPAFFDEVCYSGTGSATTQTHNLGVVPELMIIKQRSGSQDWPVYVSSIGATKIVVLSSTAAETVNTCFNDTTPTASVFSIGNGVQTNGSGSTYVAWLFATLTGVSKVGSYTGNGTTQTINCGFGAGGARFVLIKRTDTTGDWYTYDTARGMTTLTDPYLFLNTTAAEVATLGSVTTVSTGFALNSTILAAINVNGGSYLFLAIA